MRRIDVWVGVLVGLVATPAWAAPEERPALPGVIDTPSEEPIDPGAAEPGEPGDVTAPSEPGEPPAGETTPSEPPSDVAAPSEPSEPPGGEPPSDLTAPTEPSEPPATPPPAMAAPTATPPPTAPPPPRTATPVSTPPPAKPTSSPSPSSSKASSGGDASSDDGRRRSKAADEEDEEEQSEEEEDKEPIKHRGFIVDVRAGAIGCTKTICDNHGAKPGFRLDGLFGRNFLGFFDLGLAGAWGTMGTNIAPGTDGLALYGLDPATLPPEAALLMFDQFTVNDARLETIQAGLDLRVHILPRGRFDPYVGVGAQYSMFRGVYDTPGGSTRLAFHGLAFPLQAGFVVFATRRIAFGAQFDWLWSWYGGITVRGAPGDLAAPIPLIKDAAAMAGIDLPGDLPHMWSAGGVVHLRLGRK